MKIGDKVNVVNKVNKRVGNKGKYIVREEFENFYLMQKLKDGKLMYLECFMKCQFENGDLRAY